MHVGTVAPGCNERQAGTLIDATTTVAPSAAMSYEVTSPVNSNLFFTVVWNDAAVDLGLQATTLACGGAHSRCPGHALTPTGVMAIRCKQFHLPDL